MINPNNNTAYIISNPAIEAIYAELGKRIATTRKSQGLSQEDLAAKSDIDRSHMGFIEQGRRKPTVASLYKICHALKISLEDLFKGL